MLLCLSALQLNSVIVLLKKNILVLASSPRSDHKFMLSFNFSSVEAIYVVSHHCTPISAHSNVSLTTQTLSRRSARNEIEIKPRLGPDSDYHEDQFEIMTTGSFLSTLLSKMCCPLSSDTCIVRPSCYSLALHCIQLHHVEPLWSSSGTSYPLIQAQLLLFWPT